MNKRIKLVAIILVALTVAGVLAGCNVKAGQEAGMISDAIAETKAAGFTAKFEVESSTLVLYPGKQLAKYTKEADEAKKTKRPQRTKRKTKRSKQLDPPAAADASPRP